MKNLPVEHIIKILNYMRDEQKHFQQMQDDGMDVSNQAVGDWLEGHGVDLTGTVDAMWAEWWTRVGAL
jgi:hypothetical protein